MSDKIEIVSVVTWQVFFFGFTILIQEDLNARWLIVIFKFISMFQEEFQRFLKDTKSSIYFTLKICRLVVCNRLMTLVFNKGPHSTDFTLPNNFSRMPNKFGMHTGHLSPQTNLISQLWNFFENWSTDGIVFDMEM